MESIKLASLKSILSHRLNKDKTSAEVMGPLKALDLVILTRHQDEPFLRVKYEYAIGKTLLKTGFYTEAKKYFA